MVHARLIPGEETSGKLVSQVRQEAKNVARTTGRKTIIIDGPPGIGCNVISAITGADMIVIVTEPTASGLHDLQRVFTLTGKFHGKVTVIINRSSISQEYTEKIESFCNENDIEVLTKIPLDKRIVQSIVDKEIPSVKEKDFFLSFNWEEVAKKVQEKAPS
jgi:MinD superfamily P-loop ATPase